MYIDPIGIAVLMATSGVLCLVLGFFYGRVSIKAEQVLDPLEAKMQRRRARLEAEYAAEQRSECPLADE